MQAPVHGECARSWIRYFEEFRSFSTDATRVPPPPLSKAQAQPGPSYRHGADSNVRSTRIVAGEENPWISVVRLCSPRATSHGFLPRLCYNYAMSRVRVSTTVDGDLLESARRLRKNVNDANLLDEALGALIAINRAGEIDAAYASYDDAPIDGEDEWGNLNEFRLRAGFS